MQIMKWWDEQNKKFYNTAPEYFLRRARMLYFHVVHVWSGDVTTNIQNRNAARLNYDQVCTTRMYTTHGLFVLPRFRMNK